MPTRASRPLPAFGPGTRRRSGNSDRVAVDLGGRVGGAVGAGGGYDHDLDAAPCVRVEVAGELDQRAADPVLLLVGRHDDAQAGRRPARRAERPRSGAGDDGGGDGAVGRRIGARRFGVVVTSGSIRGRGGGGRGAARSAAGTAGQRLQQRVEQQAERSAGPPLRVVGRGVEADPAEPEPDGIEAVPAEQAVHLPAVQQRLGDRDDAVGPPPAAGGARLRPRRARCSR